MNDFCDGWYGRPCPPKVSTELQAKELKAKRAAQGISADGKFKVADMAVTIADVTNPTPTPVATSKVAPIKDPVQRAALGLAANANIRRAYDLDES